MYVIVLKQDLKRIIERVGDEPAQVLEGDEEAKVLGDGRAANRAQELRSES